MSITYGLSLSYQTFSRCSFYEEFCEKHRSFLEKIKQVITFYASCNMKRLVIFIACKQQSFIACLFSLDKSGLIFQNFIWIKQYCAEVLRGKGIDVILDPCVLDDFLLKKPRETNLISFGGLYHLIYKAEQNNVKFNLAMLESYYNYYYYNFIDQTFVLRCGDDLTKNSKLSLVFFMQLCKMAYDYPEDTLCHIFIIEGQDLLLPILEDLSNHYNLVMENKTMMFSSSNANYRVLFAEKPKTGNQIKFLYELPSRLAGDYYHQNYHYNADEMSTLLIAHAERFQKDMQFIHVKSIIMLDADEFANDSASDVFSEYLKTVMSMAIRNIICSPAGYILYGACNISGYWCIWFADLSKKRLQGIYLFSPVVPPKTNTTQGFNYYQRLAEQFLSLLSKVLQDITQSEERLPWYYNGDEFVFQVDKEPTCNTIGELGFQVKNDPNTSGPFSVYAAEKMMAIIVRHGNRTISFLECCSTLWKDLPDMDYLRAQDRLILCASSRQ